MKEIQINNILAIIATDITTTSNESMTALIRLSKLMMTQLLQKLEDLFLLKNMKFFHK